MKRTIKLLGIIALVAVIGFSMSACDGGNDSIKDNGDDRPPWTWRADSYNNPKLTTTYNFTDNTSDGITYYKITGSIDQAFTQGVNDIQGHSGVSLHATPNSDMLAKLKNATSFSFKVKGEGRVWLAKLNTSNITDYAFYEKAFTPQNDAGQTITITISELVRPSWGEYAPFVQSNARLITFMFEEAGDFEFTIWDLQLH